MLIQKRLKSDFFFLGRAQEEVEEEVEEEEEGDSPNQWQHGGRSSVGGEPTLSSASSKWRRV